MATSADTTKPKRGGRSDTVRCLTVSTGLHRAAEVLDAAMSDPKAPASSRIQAAIKYADIQARIDAQTETTDTPTELRQFILEHA